MPLKIFLSCSLSGGRYFSVPRILWGFSLEKHQNTELTKFSKEFGPPKAICNNNISLSIIPIQEFTCASQSCHSELPWRSKFHDARSLQGVFRSYGDAWEVRARHARRTEFDKRFMKREVLEMLRTCSSNYIPLTTQASSILELHLSGVGNFVRVGVCSSACLTYSLHCCQTTSLRQLQSPPTAAGHTVPLSFRQVWTRLCICWASSSSKF